MEPAQSRDTKLKNATTRRMDSLRRAAHAHRAKRRMAVEPAVIPMKESEGVETLDVNQPNAIDLKKRFPISVRLTLKHMLPWLLAFAGLFILYWRNFAPYMGPPPDPSVEQPTLAYAAHSWQLYAINEMLLYGVAIAFLTGMTVYHELQRAFFQYKIEGSRIIIHRGLIFIDEGSLPLIAVAEIFAHRELRDVLLGLYQVHLNVPIHSVKGFSKIDGLTRKDAMMLIDFLSAQLNKGDAKQDPSQQFDPDVLDYDQGYDYEGDRE